ncbi:pimeloyl-ACP methyl ester carboxylesterase [Nocardia sp. GAS34]|uniref:alpha/beta fold hydrolase n=1 Tax=unclassified Nocardia TaxID=2637762 RepID=UPI003D21E558
MHFRGNLDNWDPALIDALAQHRRVIAVDYQGVGGSSGTPADTVEQMAREVLAFTAALHLETFDLLGFSIGSFVAQRIALTRPDSIGKVVLASTAPQGAPDMHGWAADVIGAIGGPETSGEQYLDVFFTSSESSRAAGQGTLSRIYGRTEGRDAPTDWATRMAQYDAVATWGIPNIARLSELTTLTAPVFVANGDSDPMILPKYSYLVAGLLPNATRARVTVETGSQRTSLTPFGGEQRRTSYSPDLAAVLFGDGRVDQARNRPRAAFATDPRPHRDPQPHAGTVFRRKPHPAAAGLQLGDLRRASDRPRAVRLQDRRRHPLPDATGNRAAPRRWQCRRASPDRHVPQRHRSRRRLRAKGSDGARRERRLPAKSQRTPTERSPATRWRPGAPAAPRRRAIE